MADKQEPPLWLDAVRRFERAIGTPIESAVTSDTYFDAVAQLKRAQAQLAGVVETLTNDIFRLFNIPTGSDVRRMREQLSRMERCLEAMSKELARRDAQDGHGRPSPGKRRAAADRAVDAEP